MKDIKCKYIISFGIKDNIIVAIVALLFDTAAYFMYRQGTAVFIPFAVFGGFVTVLFLISLYRTLFNKICIYDDYFIHIKSPFKDVIINDYEVDDAWINQKKNAKGTAGCYFNYVTKDGRKGKLLIPPAKYDFADYLVERLKGNDVYDYEQHINEEYGLKKSDIPKNASLFERFFIYSKAGPIFIVVFVIVFFVAMFTHMILYGGNKTPYTAVQAAEVMENYGYEAIDNTEAMRLQNTSIKQSMECTSNDPFIEFTFLEMDSTESAKELFASLHKQLWDRHIYNTVIGESFYNNYTSKTYHLENDYYSEIVRVSNTVVIAQSKEDSKGKIYELLTAMDYDQNTDNFKTKTK